MTLISYQDAATRLGIPAEDRDGFFDFVSSFEGRQLGGVRPDLFQHIAEDYLLDGAYRGSTLESRVLEARLSDGLPLLEAISVASRLAASPASAEGYHLLVHTLRTQIAYMPGKRLTGDQLALVMAVPDEDRSAFVELLYNWLADEEEWQEQVSGRGYSVGSEPIPRTILDEFWESYPLSQPYPGSDLEAEVLANRAVLVRSVGEAKRVLFRMYEYGKANPDRPVGALRGFFTCLQEGLSSYAFEEAPPALKAA